MEGDYRPAETPSSLQPVNARIDAADLAFLMRMTDALNTTLDLETLLGRTAELVRSLIPYRLFAVFLLNDRLHDLFVRFQTGHTPEMSRVRVPVGKGVVGQVAMTRQPLLINDAATEAQYIVLNPEVKSELAVPLIAKNRLIGVMDLESEEAGFFRPEHLHLLTMTASRIAQAIENARLYTRVSRQAQQLEVLNEIAVELASILELKPLLERVGQLLRRLIEYQIFSIMLLDDKGETLITRYSWRFGYSNAPMRRMPVSTGLVGAAVREWRPINVPDVEKDPRYIPLNAETRSELIVPLFYKGKIIGVLDLEHTKPGFFNDQHERILTTAAAQIAIAIENARLYQAVREQERQLERDLATARQVQLRLLPAEPPRHKNAELAARFLPARTIGGDLYDFLGYGKGRSAIMLGDVSGKAAPAALFAALVSGLMRSAVQQRPAPAEMLTRLNDALQERKLESQYVVMVFAVWNDETRTLQVANSGASQPLLCRASGCSLIKVEGFPLGMFPNASYDELSVTIEPGDLVAFVSDGILDAENRHGEMYGQERLEAVLSSHRGKTAAVVADAILADVTRFEEGRDRFDDETIVVLRAK
jgi:sigma-B regulation protein RsbU (phosphoserine phosphatase)